MRTWTCQYLVLLFLVQGVLGEIAPSKLRYNLLNLNYDHCRYPQTYSRELHTCICPESHKKIKDSCICDSCFTSNEKNVYNEKDVNPYESGPELLRAFENQDKQERPDVDFRLLGDYNRRSGYGATWRDYVKQSFPNNDDNINEERLFQNALDEERRRSGRPSYPKYPEGSYISKRLRYRPFRRPYELIHRPIVPETPYPYKPRIIPYYRPIMPVRPPYSPSLPFHFAHMPSFSRPPFFPPMFHKKPNSVEEFKHEFHPIVTYDEDYKPKFVSSVRPDFITKVPPPLTITRKPTYYTTEPTITNEAVDEDNEKPSTMYDAQINDVTSQAVSDDSSLTATSVDSQAPIDDSYTTPVSTFTESQEPVVSQFETESTQTVTERPPEIFTAPVVTEVIKTPVTPSTSEAISAVPPVMEVIQSESPAIPAATGMDNFQTSKAPETSVASALSDSLQPVAPVVGSSLPSKTEMVPILEQKEQKIVVSEDKPEKNATPLPAESLPVVPSATPPPPVISKEKPSETANVENTKISEIVPTEPQKQVPSSSETSVSSSSSSDKNFPMDAKPVKTLTPGIADVAVKEEKSITLPKVDESLDDSDEDWLVQSEEPAAKTFSDSVIGSETAGSINIGRYKARGAIKAGKGTGSMSLGVSDDLVGGSAMTGAGEMFTGLSTDEGESSGHAFVGKKSQRAQSTTAVVMGEGDVVATNARGKKGSASSTSVATDNLSTVGGAAYGPASATGAATPGGGATDSAASFNKGLSSLAKVEGQGGPISEVASVGNPDDDINNLNSTVADPTNDIDLYEPVKETAPMLENSGSTKQEGGEDQDSHDDNFENFFMYRKFNTVLNLR